jgi:hypothetical protein
MDNEVPDGVTDQNGVTDQTMSAGWLGAVSGGAAIAAWVITCTIGASEVGSPLKGEFGVSAAAAAVLTAAAAAVKARSALREFAEGVRQVHHAARWAGYRDGAADFKTDY